MDYADKESWRCNAPLTLRSCPLMATYTMDEFQKIARGFVPVEAEDKWFIYLEQGRLYFHLSHTGDCFFAASIVKRGLAFEIIEILVNDEKNRFNDGDSASLMRFLIDRILLNKMVLVPTIKLTGRDIDVEIDIDDLVGGIRSNKEKEKAEYEKYIRKELIRQQKWDWREPFEIVYDYARGQMPRQSEVRRKKFHDSRSFIDNYVVLDMSLYFKEPYEKEIQDHIETQVVDFENTFFPKKRSLSDVLRAVMVTKDNDHILNYLEECQASGLLRFEFRSRSRINCIEITVRDIPKDVLVCRERLKPFKSLIRNVARHLEEQKLKAKLFLRMRDNDHVLDILKTCIEDK